MNWGGGGGMMVDSPFTMFRKDKLSLPLHPKFLPKVESCFHLNQPIRLLAFFLKPPFLHHFSFLKYKAPFHESQYYLQVAFAV